MKKEYSIDVTVRVVIEAETQHEAENLFTEQFFSQYPFGQYYNLQSREGVWHVFYVGDETDVTVWRPSVTLGEGKHYFTSDGTYGNASDLAVIDTSNWKESDWERVEDCSDNDRQDIADIIDKFRSGVWA